MQELVENDSLQTTQKTNISVAQGDGIGPEIMDASLQILEAAKAPFIYHPVNIGKTVYEQGISSGIPQEAWDTIRKTRILLKGPITTPQGGGYKSINVTLRKALGLFANVRQSKAYTPFVASSHPEMNVVVIRENEEDLYAGIEHQQTQEVTQILKLISRPGSERIIRYAFEYARAYGRKKLTCMTKDNIMKITDGLFHQLFREIAAAYPEIQAEHQIIDIGAAKLASNPETFDVIVTLNLYGDILSDITAQLAGSVGLAGSANIGESVAMFEAVHGSAPDIAGKGIANPSGLLVAATQMLVHVGASESAQLIKNAWLKTLEDGIHTVDIYREGVSARTVGTEAFCKAIIERLGDEPKTLEPVRYHQGGINIMLSEKVKKAKELVGIDIFLDWDEHMRDPNILGRQLQEIATAVNWQLSMVTNRGIKVFPDGLPETFCTDHWRCRFVAKDLNISYKRVLELLAALDEGKLEVIKTEHLYEFDGEKAFSLGQGQ